MTREHQPDLSLHDGIGFRSSRRRVLDRNTIQVAYLAQRLVSIAIDNNVRRFQLVHNTELNKRRISIATSQRPKWHKDPIVGLEGTYDDTIPETTVSRSVVEVLDVDLIHRNDHATILLALLERSRVVLLLSRTSLTAFTGSTRRLVA